MRNELIKSILNVGSVLQKILEEGDIQNNPNANAINILKEQYNSISKKYIDDLFKLENVEEIQGLNESENKKFCFNLIAEIQKINWI